LPSGETIVSKEKGDILEKIVAELHSLPGVRLTRNARIKPLGGKGRGRDIDVLLEATVAGYEIQIAIECKNERKKIGAPKIDEFAGRLGEVGIPTRHGIFVSASGFTIDALRSAAAHRIRPLVLTGLADGGLRDEVSKALCSTIYLLADVVDFTIENCLPNPSLYERNALYTDGKFEGMVLDWMANLWIQEQIPSSLGKHWIELPLKPGTYQVVAGQKIEINRITTNIEVIGLALRMDAKAIQHALVDPLTQSAQKLKTIITLDPSPEAKSPLTVVRTDDDAKRLCVPPYMTSVVSRVRLPRIRYGAAYWPLSRRARTRMRQAVEAFQKGEGPNPSELTFIDIEGDDLAENFKG
jgi:hypothetical protein